MKLLLPGIMALMLTGCSVESRLNDMRDSTKNVSKTTREMKDSTDKVAKTSDGMAEDTKAMRQATESMQQAIENMSKKTDEVVKTTAGVEAKTDQVYSDARQAQSLEIRTKSLSELEDTEDQVAKLSQAAHYFMAFEFQLWKNTSTDSLEKLAYLKRDAIDEFMRDVRRYIPESHTLNPSRTDQKSKNLYALVATMHVLNSNSLPKEKGGGTSMVDLLSEGLLAKAKVESGEVKLSDLPEYQRAVLSFERDVVYLLNLRINFIPSMIVTELATKNGRYLSKLDLASMLVFPWRAYTSERNLGHFRLYSELLDEAAKAKNVLRLAGANVKIYPGLVQILKKMRFRSQDSAAESEVRRAAIEKLRAQIEDFKAQKA